MVGSPQEIHCTVSTVSGVELSSVMISWMGPGGDTIRNDSRVTISPIISINNDYISTLEFTYLMEGDEGTYTCNVMILETIGSDTITINNLTGKLIKLCIWMAEGSVLSSFLATHHNLSGLLGYVYTNTI